MRVLFGVSFVGIDIDNTPFSGLSDKEEETEEDDDDEEGDDDEDDDDDELDEEELIKQMLAKEQQKLSQENNPDDTDGNENEETDAPSAPSDSEHFSEQTTSSSDVISSATAITTSATKTVSHSNSSSTVSSTANTYPVSSTGRCPYCSASDVKYIIIVSENTKDTELPQSLQELLKRNHAFKMAKGEVDKARKASRETFNHNYSKTESYMHWVFSLLQHLSELHADTFSFIASCNATPASHLRLIPLCFLGSPMQLTFHP